MKPRTGRNNPCPCGSGRKYKKCCLPKDREKPSLETMNDSIISGDDPPLPRNKTAVSYTIEAQRVCDIGFMPRVLISHDGSSGKQKPDCTLVKPDELYRSREAADSQGGNEVGVPVLGAAETDDNDVQDLLKEMGYVSSDTMNKSVADFKKELQPLEDGERPVCGLCGNMLKLTKTPCCQEWICDDEDNYVIFSYADNSCYRNHRRYTLCGEHYAEEHEGSWQDCDECRDNALNTEMYVWYGTNEYNFESLDDPPSFEPTHCAECGRRIQMGEENFSMSGGSFLCHECTDFPMGGL